MSWLGWHTHVYICAFVGGVAVFVTWLGLCAPLKAGDWCFMTQARAPGALAPRTMGSPAGVQSLEQDPHLGPMPGQSPSSSLPLGLNFWVCALGLSAEQDSLGQHQAAALCGLDPLRSLAYVISLMRGCQPVGGWWGGWGGAGVSGVVLSPQPAPVPSVTLLAGRCPPFEGIH